MKYSNTLFSCFSPLTLYLKPITETELFSSSYIYLPLFIFIFPEMFTPIFAYLRHTSPNSPFLLDCFRNIISVNLHKSHMRWEFLAFIFPLEEEMATHSSILTWKIPWTEEPGGLQSVELQTVGHN